LSIRARMYPTPAQAEAMVVHCSHARFVWNLAVEQSNMWRRDRGPTPNLAVQMRQLSAARREHPWLGAGSSVVQQAALRDFDRARQAWWGNPAHFSRPTWRKKGVHEGFVIRDLTVTKINHRWGTVLVPKVGAVKFRSTRPWAQIGAASSARVTFKAGRWHVCLVTPPPVFDRKPTGAVTGIDRGVANTIATSESVMGSIPGWTPGEQARYVVLQQQLARQVKGSNRRAITKGKIARLHQRLTDRRTDWIEQTTTALVREHDLIGIEALNTRGMVRKPAPKPDPENTGVFLPNGAKAKAALNKAIHASCWGKFAKRLHDKADHTPAGAKTLVVEVPARYTSQRCHHCGHTAPENRKSQAEFRCVDCGHKANADTNAAENILSRAITLAAGQAVDPKPKRRKVDGRNRGTTTTASTTREPAAA